jgi:hypothetical protein
VAQRKTTRKTSKRRTVSKSMKKAAVPRRTRSSSAARTNSEKSKPAGDEEVTIDRRRANRREESSSGVAKTATAPPLERRQKVNRRRQIDPTTCERDYTDQEVEFMNALDDYKRKSGRMFPTCSEVLEVIRSLGYIKVSAAESAARADASSSVVSAKPMPSDWSAIPQEATTVAGVMAEPQLQS